MTGEDFIACMVIATGALLSLVLPMCMPPGNIFERIFAGIVTITNHFIKITTTRKTTPKTRH
jgi:hypothetical protein